VSQPDVRVNQCSSPLNPAAKENSTRPRRTLYHSGYTLESEPAMGARTAGAAVVRSNF
jgi:hypothetical protein